MSENNKNIISFVLNYLIKKSDKVYILKNNKNETCSFQNEIFKFIYCPTNQILKYGPSKKLTELFPKNFSSDNQEFQNIDPIFQDNQRISFILPGYIFTIKYTKDYNTNIDTIQIYQKTVIEFSEEVTNFTIHLMKNVYTAFNKDLHEQNKIYRVNDNLINAISKDLISIKNEITLNSEIIKKFEDYIQKFIKSKIDNKEFLIKNDKDKKQLFEKSNYISEADFYSPYTHKLNEGEKKIRKLYFMINLGNDCYIMITSNIEGVILGLSRVKNKYIEKFLTFTKDFQNNTNKNYINYDDKNQGPLHEKILQYFQFIFNYYLNNIDADSINFMEFLNELNQEQITELNNVFNPKTTSNSSPNTEESTPNSTLNQTTQEGLLESQLL